MHILRRWFFIFTSIFAVGFFSACTDKVVRFSPIGSRFLSSHQWNSPVAADYLVVDPALSASLGPVTSTFNDYQLAKSPDSSAALLAGTFYNGTFFRAVGRTYNSYSANGSGWAAWGSDFKYLDTGVADIGKLALGYAPVGDALAVFSDGLLFPQNQSSFYDPVLKWSTILSAPGPATNPIISSLGLGWKLSSDTAYLVYTDSTQNAYLQTYSTASGWLTGAPKWSKNVQRLQAIQDGLGVTMVWNISSQDISITSGTNHSCAWSLSSHEVRCWGRNQLGQLGAAAGVPGSNTSQPAPVLGVNSDLVSQVSSGGDNTCSLSAGGTVKCWGAGALGQLGVGGSIPGANSASPIAVAGLTGVTQIAVGGSHACALLSTGSISCWGDNTEGQLGNAAALPAAPSAAPVSVNGITTATYIAAGKSHSCAILADTSVRCWGKNTNGQLGSGAALPAASSSTAVTVSGVGGATQLVAGLTHSCALLAGNTVSCWGGRNLGQLGDSSAVPSADTSTAVAVSGVANASQIAGGDNHSCIRRTTGVVSCWGDNARGQLGSGGVTPSSVATAVTNITAGIQVSAGGTHSCAVVTGGITACWGENTYGQLGTGAALPGADIYVPTATQPVVTCPTGGCVLAAWSEEQTLASIKTLTTSGNSSGFAVDSDGHGNVVVAFLQDQTLQAACQGVSQCQARVVAYSRTATGVWSGPFQVDSDSAILYTTGYQNGAVVGGQNYATPGVAYVGNGKFVVTYTLLDYTTASAPVSQVRSRGFTVNGTWETNSTLVESVALNGSDQYRMVNELKFAGDLNGAAVLVLQKVLSTANGTTAATRSYGYTMYAYYAGKGWAAPYEVASLPGCAAADPLCSNLNLQSVVFPSGEAVVVVPAPADGYLTTKMRLYSLIFN
ncbi:hypothetical protein K2X30_00515 [bacterium]|jgi:alpha-tubulin suppressor-like RCC1 family protein|nr:hypothetical protein [bacterium]